MQLPQIRLESQQAKIQMHTIPPKQSIEQPPAQLDLQQPRAELTIERTPGKLTIDQTKAWEDMDLKHIFRRIEEFAQKGYEDWLKGLERMAQDGDELMRIENGGNPLAEQTKRNGESPIYDFNIGFVPSHFSVKTNYEPAKLNIQWKVNKPINNTKPQKPIIEYEPGKVEIAMKQYANLKVDFVNLKFVGINYEQQI
jgi:hypothetical protein